MLPNINWVSNVSLLDDSQRNSPPFHPPNEHQDKLQVMLIENNPFNILICNVWSLNDTNWIHATHQRLIELVALLMFLLGFCHALYAMPVSYTRNSLVLLFFFFLFSSSSPLSQQNKQDRSSVIVGAQFFFPIRPWICNNSIKPFYSPASRQHCSLQRQVAMSFLLDNCEFNM